MAGFRILKSRTRRLLPLIAKIILPHIDVAALAFVLRKIGIYGFSISAFGTVVPGACFAGIRSAAKQSNHWCACLTKSNVVLPISQSLM